MTFKCPARLKPPIPEATDSTTERAISTDMTVDQTRCGASCLKAELTLALAARFENNNPLLGLMSDMLHVLEGGSGR